MSEPPNFFVFGAPKSGMAAHFGMRPRRVNTRPRISPGLVSVVIPTHDRAHLLPETLESIRVQTHRPIEIIVVDDGSTDDTEAVVHRASEAMTTGHGAIDSLEYLKQPRRGAPAARNAGLARAGGEFVQFLDSDDLLRATKLQRCVLELKATGAAVVVMDAERFETGAPGRRQRIRFAQRSPRTLTTHVLSGLTNGQSCLFTRAATERLGPWREDLRIWQDFEYTARIFAMGLPVRWIPSLGTRIRNTSGSIMGQPERAVYGSRIRACEAVEAVARAHGAFSPELEAAIGRRLGAVARRLSGEAGPAYETVRREALRRAPLPDRLKYRVHWTVAGLLNGLGSAGRSRP
jgi:glycosyltransferase involved in cell wall biosynthesis